jgi:hypothetical protein
VGTVAVETQHELAACTLMTGHLTLVTKVTDDGLKVTLTFIIFIQVKILLEKKKKKKKVIKKIDK